jgi:hypothetical protein
MSRLTRALRTPALPALVLASLAACSDGPTGNDDALDTDAVQAQQVLMREALSVPVLYSLFGSMDSEIEFGRGPSFARTTLESADPLSGVTSDGTSMRDVMRAVLPATQATAAEGEGAYVPVAQWGRTYVKDNVNGGMRWDESRTDAPARGVRIVLYQRTGPETFGNTPVGALDVIDSSTTQLTLGRLNLYDGGGQLVGTFRETSTSMAETATSMTATFTGTVGVAPKTFTVADTMSGAVTQTASGMTTNLRWRSIGKANFTNAQRSLTVTGMDLGSDSESGTAEWEITVGGHVTKIVGSGSPDGVTGDTRIYIDGKHVASADAMSQELRSPNGGTVSPKLQMYLMHVLMTAFQIPDSLLVRFIVLMHIPFY